MDFENVELFDYLCFCNGNISNYKLACVVTDKQRIIRVDEKSKSDHWDIVEDIYKEVFPGEDVEVDNLFDGAILMFSNGNDLLVDLPEKVSEQQLDCLLDLLRQARNFEEESGNYLYMTYNSRELVDMARQSLSSDKKEKPNEIIIGKELVKKKKTV